MTTIDGQVDIFGDVFTDPKIAERQRKAEQKRRKADRRPWTCPHCGYHWPGPHLSTDGRDGLIAWHLEGKTNGKVYAPINQGRCSTQDLYLGWMHTRRDKSGRKGIKWDRESDILGLILQAKTKGCTDDELATALAVPWDTT